MDEDIEEDDGERYSSYSLSSMEDDNGGGKGRKAVVAKVTYNDDVKNPGKYGDDTTDTTTSQPPDVIMDNHKQSSAKRSRRGGRRGKRSANTMDSAQVDQANDDPRTTSIVAAVGKEVGPSPLEVTKNTPTGAGTDVDKTISSPAAVVSAPPDANGNGPSTSSTDADNIDSTGAIVTTTSCLQNDGDQSTATALQSSQVRVVRGSRCVAQNNDIILLYCIIFSDFYVTVMILSNV